MQIKGKRNQSLSLLYGWRDSCPRSMLSTQRELTSSEEQRLLKDHLFHGCKKSIWDSVKYCFADPHIDYMHFLEECRKAEDEDKVDQIKNKTTKG